MAMISCSYIMSHIVFLSEPDVELDVETPPFKPVVPYDPVKARSMMTECERQVTNSCAEEGPDDWEDNVTRLERRIHYVKTWSSSLVIHGLTNSPWLSNILEFHEKGSSSRRRKYVRILCSIVHSMENEV